MRQFCSAAMCAFAFLISLAAQPVRAQVAAQGPSFIKPFPKSDVYSLKLVGDWFADGLRSAVAESLLDAGQVRTERDVVQVRSLRSSNWDTIIDRVESSVTGAPFDIAIVMFGAAEIGSLGVPGRRRVPFGTDDWKKRYGVRVERLMKALKKGETAVYWIGMPTLQRGDRNEGAQVINEILRERAYVNGIKYIDSYAGFADEEGNYDAYGPDLSGKTRRLRARDGVYFTGAGYQKLAHFAKRIIARDLRRAVSERTIPLAGSELEQSRINPRKTASTVDGAAPQPAETPRASTSSRIGSTTTSAPSPIVNLLGLKDQKADNSRIALRTVVDGVARTEEIKIVRPAISAAVLSLLTRRQSASRANQIGDNVAVELPGGIVLLSSVTPVRSGTAAGNRGRLSPSQSPFFKVWAKGERLTPRPGRADDVEWPRPEPQPVVRAKLVPQPQGFASQPRRQRRKFTPEGFPPLPDPNPRAR